MYCIIKITSRSLTFYNLFCNETLLTPSTHQKNFMQNVGGRKKYLAGTYPKKKNSWGIKGLKKNSCLYQITHPPTPQKLNGWPLRCYSFNIQSKSHGTLSQRRQFRFQSCPSWNLCLSLNKSQANCALLRGWTSPYGAAVRQPTVYQETTMAKHVALYPSTCTVDSVSY